MLDSYSQLSCFLKDRSNHFLQSAVNKLVILDPRIFCLLYKQTQLYKLLLVVRCDNVRYFIIFHFIILLDCEDADRPKQANFQAMKELV